MSTEIKMEMAIDGSGNSVQAKDAQTGKQYYCPYCHIPMYKNHSKLGTAFFATIPGGVHTAHECEMISCETESARRRYAMEKTNPRSLLRSLLREPTQGEPQDPAEAHTHGKHDHHGITPEALRPFRSLAELYNSGVCSLPPSTRMGNGVLRDCCACWGTEISAIITDPLYSGERIILAGMDDIAGDDLAALGEMIDNNRPSISFPLYARVSDNNYRRKYLVLTCSTEDLLGSIIDALYSRTIDDNGRVVYKARCRTVLVAGRWHRGSCDACPHTCTRQTRKDCCGALVAEYVSPRQIYGIVDTTQEISEVVDAHDDTPIIDSELVEL